LEQRALHFISFIELPQTGQTVFSLLGMKAVRKKRKLTFGLRGKGKQNEGKKKNADF